MLNFTKIYEQLKIPPNLQEHHFRVASVGLTIADHWTGENLDRLTLAQALMTHDLGNIIKFDLDKYPHLLQDNGEGIEYWKQVQRETIQQYGTDAHTGTIAMAQEIGARPSVIKLLEFMGSSQADKTLATGSWEDNILLYSDMRVMPQGIVSLAERFLDISLRYSHRLTHEEILRRQNATEEIEQRLQKNCSLNLKFINDEVVEHYRTELQNLGL